MATMRAMVLRDWGTTLDLGEVERPTPGQGQVVVKVESCGVGLTVLHVMRGYVGSSPDLLPLVPGHEIAGVVSEIGPGVTNVKPGDRVFTSYHLTCGYCSFCRRGRESLCLNHRGFVGVNINGGYTEYAAVPAINCIPLPEGIPWAEATAIPDAIGTPYHACTTRAKVRPGDRVVVIGAAGGVGIHMVQMARLFGGDVIAVDIDDAKLARTKEYGASATINFRDPEPERRLLEATGGERPDVVIDMIGNQATCDWGVQVAARDGRIVHLASTEPDAMVHVKPSRLIGDEVTVTGSRYVSKWELLETAALVRDGKIRPVVSEVVPLPRVGEIIEKLLAQKLFGRGALTP